MDYPKFSIVFLTLTLTLINLASAQNSPQDFVDAHTPARAEVGLRPLVWNDKVAAYAQKYADVRSQDCEMIHSPDRPYGENLAGGSWDLSAKETVDMWVEEKQYYDVQTNSCIGDNQCLHYTQVVWRNSTEVGCGRSHCQNGWTFVTCNYNPPGNYVGERPY